MSMRNTLKAIIKKPFNLIGLDVVRRPRQVIERDEPIFRKTDWAAHLGIQSILDIGAHTGDFAVEMAARFPQVQIYSFEPLVDSYSKLVEKSKSLPRIRTFNYALGDTNGKVEIHKNSFSPSSSVLEMAPLHRSAFPITATEQGIETIDIRRLDDVAKDFNLAVPLLVKIDVQGFEGRVILGGQDTLKSACALIVEVSFYMLYERQPLFHEIYMALRELGFSYAGNWDQLHHPADGRILQADAIFLRGEL
jgi:FkbM family methyltransferase